MKKAAAILLACTMLVSVCACAPSDKNAATEETQPIPVAVPPENMEIRSVLMIGNSACYYFCDELFEMAKAAGIELVVANLYISGCRLDEHVANLEAGKAYTSFTIRETTGVTTYKGEITMSEVLQLRQWDAISLQQNYRTLFTLDLKTATTVSNKYAKALFDHYKSVQPEATLFWHQTWVAQRGVEDPNNPDNSILTEEKQSLIASVVRQSSHMIAHENGAYLIPVGDAWQKARADAAIGDTLCIKDTAGNTDYIHDGEVGGGQYLNACVWYEVLLKRSCIGNTFRPSYGLSEEKVAALQQIAHETVAELYGADYAK